MYQTKAEAVEALADVKLEIENILEGGVWIDEEDEEFLRDIEAVAYEMEEMLCELEGAIMQLEEATSNEYLDQHHRNYVSLTIVEAKMMISKFNILQSEIA